MRRLPGRTKLFIGSWYIGAGNKPSVISQTPNKAFSKIREAYKEKAGTQYGVTGNNAQVSFTEKDRQEIRHTIAKQYQQQFIKKIIIVVISIAITILALALFAFLLKPHIKSLPI